MTALPALSCFRIEHVASGVVHFVFDLPGRSMNVFTNAAIRELGLFAQWLKESDVVGVVVRSAKPAFCAGADLSELGTAYGMIMAAPKGERDRLAFDHFVQFSRALRALETSGKPVAAAISGLALGGGFELALGCHYRVVADMPKTGLGLPESLVGLLPGAGGTQRLPRLAGVAASLPILLAGKRFSATEAVSAGAAHEIVPPGEEVAAAERWVRSGPDPRQPWDRPDWTPPADAAVVAAARTRVMAETHGHYPAPLAILDCVETGIGAPMDRALVTEMEIFSRLIQRPEPRNMIRTLFTAKGEYEKLRGARTLPPGLDEAVAAVRAALATDRRNEALGKAVAEAGFSRPLPASGEDARPVARETQDDAGPGEESAGLWFEGSDLSPAQCRDRDALLAAATAVASFEAKFGERERSLVDHAVVAELGFPAYLGGPFALRRYLGRDRLSALLRDQG